jgi:phosphate transport system permease protein
MSTSTISHEPVSVPTPLRPWKLTPRAVAPQIGLALGSCVVAVIAVVATGLAGFDGWLLIFAPLSIIGSWIIARGKGAVGSVDAAVGNIVILIAGISFYPVVSLLWTVISEGISALRWNFLSTDMRLASPDDELNMGGAAHALVGTLVMVAIASVITLPLGILTAVYVTEVKGRLRSTVRFIVQSMSGVPSIVAGLFIYSTVVMTMQRFTGLAGGLALAILMLPTVARTAEEVLKLVPDDLRSASYALGAPQWRTTLLVVLPTVRSGIVTSGILGVARIAGETAPLLLTASYFTAQSFSPLEGPMASLPVFTFGLLQSGTENSFARAWACSLLLLLAVFVLFSVARALSGKDKR